MNQRIKWPNQPDRGQNGPIKDSEAVHVDSILNSHNIKIEKNWYIDSKIYQFPLAPLLLQAYNRIQIAEESLKRANRSERAGRKTTGLTPGYRGMVAGLPSERIASLLASHVRVAHTFGGWKMSTRFRSTELSPIPRLLGWLGLILMCCFTNAVFAGQATLAWDPSSSSASGYRVYYGTASGNYTSNVNVGNATTSTVSNLTDDSTYYFSVKAYDSEGNESGFSNEVSQTTVAVPVASFSADKTSGTAPVTVNLADTSTGTVSTRAWDLGDGTTSTAQSVAKTYSAAGTYTVKLTVSNSGGSTTATKTISVTTSTTTVPVASFSATPISGTAPLLVTLTDTSTGTVSTRTWDLGDGTTSTAQSVAKTYNVADTYTVKLTVSNAGGSSTTSKTISTTTAAPVVDFSATTTSGPAPLTVSFVNNSSGDIQSWSWNFGDEGTSTEQHPVHTYTKEGSYDVSLTATSSTGIKVSKILNGYITVSNAESGILEVGETDVNGDWKQITFNKLFKDPVVVTNPLNFDVAQPGVIRIRNVNASGFEIRSQAWDYLGETQVIGRAGYLVMERGSHTLDNGTQVEAGQIDTNLTGSFGKVKFSKPFSVAPVVITGVASVNENSAVVTRVKRVTGSSFYVGMQEEEANTQQHATETIAYIAWQPSSGTVEGLDFQVGNTADIVTDQFYTLVYPKETAVPPMFLADMQTTGGGDTANLRWQNKSRSSVQVKVAEEQSKGNETRHTTEVVGYILLTPNQ